jgi:hypothetical protein
MTTCPPQPSPSELLASKPPQGPYSYVFLVGALLAVAAIVIMLLIAAGD